MAESRAGIVPLDRAIPAERQLFARHYGVHPYFTRRPANVVKTYIEHYSLPHDVILDPFGGSGVTAIEALLTGRRGIHNDLNPFANFITKCIADTTVRNLDELPAAFRRVEDETTSAIQRIEGGSDRAVLHLLKKLPLPKNIRLPKSSDAEHFFDLFTTRQLAGLATLKQSIDREPRQGLRAALLLAWSASAAKLNRTFLSAKGRTESRGGSSIFSIYRYKLAKNPIQLPILETFRGRFQNVVRAKAEVLQAIEHYRQTHPDESPISSDKALVITSHDASSLSRHMDEESVDYIFTDPPYGAHIAYLDLSVLWNHWLGFHISRIQLEAEAIVGGSLKLSEEIYKIRLADSVRDCARLLKPGRWFSIVFQHWDPSYFATILSTAADSGLTLKAAITHEQEVIWSMHKKKNSENVLAGEMILTFLKPVPRQSVAERTRRYKVVDNSNFESLLDKVLANTTNTRTSFSSEHIFNQIILQAWNDKALSALAIRREEFANALRARGWMYDAKIHEWIKGRASDRQPLLFDL